MGQPEQSNSSEALQVPETGKNLEQALTEVDSLFEGSQKLAERGKEEIKAYLKELAADSVKNMGQQAWENYSKVALQKLDGLFQQLGLDDVMQLEVLQVLDGYLDLEVSKGLEGASVGLGLLGQAVDVRLSRAGGDVSIAEATADFDFGAIQSNFLYTPETGLQFKIDATAAGALVQLAGNPQDKTGAASVQIAGQKVGADVSLEGGRAQLNAANLSLSIRGTQMDFVKLGDMYEVTVRLGDHLKLGSSLDPSGRMSAEMGIPFKEGVLALAPTLSLGANGMPKLDGMELKLERGNRKLKLGYDAEKGGNVEYSRQVASRSGQEVQVSAQASKNGDDIQAEGGVSLIF